MAVSPEEIKRAQSMGISERALPREDANGEPVRFDLALPLDKVPAKKGTKQSSNGLYLLDDETERFAAKFLPLHAVRKVSFMEAMLRFCCGPCLACKVCCGCYITIPKQNQCLEICITDKRILMRDIRRKINPGIKSVWYWLCCCCCVTKETDEKFEGQNVLNLDDLKDVHMDISQTKGRYGPSCCPAERNQDQFTMILYFTKDVGVYHLPSKDWAFADENKTSHMKSDPIVAFGNMEEAAEMRRILEQAVARNQARDANNVATTARNLTNASH